MPAITHALALRKGRIVAQGKRKDVLKDEVLSRTFDVHVDIHKRGGRLWPIVLRLRSEDEYIDKPQVKEIYRRQDKD